MVIAGNLLNICVNISLCFSVAILFLRECEYCCFRICLVIILSSFNLVTEVIIVKLLCPEFVDIASCLACVTVTATS